MHSNPNNDVRGRRELEFARELARALQLYGAPAHRLENAVREIVSRIGVQAEIFSTPTAIFAQFELGGEKRIELIRATPGEVDLARLADVTDLANEVAEGKIDSSEGLERLRSITEAPPLYNTALTTLSFGLTSAAASRFFGAGVEEMIGAALAGFSVGLLALLASRIPAIARVFDPLAGFVVSFVTIAAAASIFPLSIPIATVAGLIALIPGLTLTIAVTELAEKNLVSGTARLNGAIVVFLMLGFGVAFGGAVATRIFGPVRIVDPTPTGIWIEIGATILAAATLTILFKAHPKDFPAILVACALTYGTVRAISPRIGPELGVFVGAVVCGIVSNAYARWRDRPAAVTRLPSMMLLVPGGLGFIGLSRLLEKNVLEGMQTAFSVALLAVALVTGLLVANGLVPPGHKKL